ncbi:MFS transporter [Streptomyces sp. AP-93]|uniref:MFS transporter n=1 Tax=Streptomyces sp. AP-93 TaxID=2929048 RepID=UPI001FAF92F3|nr:MFS transporter [Streptomyces sp. AP-93]MCJ0875557.1 MFS transporter [Streptomyces sp. AP-93]
MRRFAIANLINTVGSGLYITGGTLYFTRVVGLTVSETALGMTLGTAIGLAFMMGFGRLADRIGPKPVYLCLLVVQGLAMAAFTQVRSFPAFLAIAIVSGIADRGISGTVGALIHSMSGTANRVTARAQLRTATNVGLGVGTLIAGAALTADTTGAYTLVVAGNALLFFTAASLLAGVRVEHQLRRAGSAAAAFRGPRPLRDVRYLAVTAANGLLTLHAAVLSFALPLWVADHTQAPKWSIAVVLVVNTILVVLLQVRTSKHAATVPKAARMAWISGLVFAAAALVMAGTTALGPALCLVVLLIWALIYTAGELLQTSSEFCLGFELAADEAQGAYQSTFALGPGVMRALGPSLLALAVLESGSTGWIALGGLFAVSGGLVSVAALWALRNRSEMHGEASVPAQAERQPTAAVS